MATTKGKSAPLDSLRAELRLSRTGRFYKLSRSLTSAEHEQLIEKAAKPFAYPDSRTVALSGLGAPERREVRSKALGTWQASGATVEAFGTLLIRPVLDDAGIATSASGLKELKFAHVLLLEGAVTKGRITGQRYAFVNRELFQDPLISNSMGVVQPLGRAELLNPFLSSSLPHAEAGRIEELSMRMMNVSRVGLRRKVVEAHDVESSVSSLGLHRTIPGTMRIRLPRNSGVGTAVTISTGRHSLRAGSSRVKLSTVTDWFAQCVVRLDAEAGKARLGNDFLREMAEPLDTLDNLVPGSLLLDFSALEEEGLGTGGLTWQPTTSTPSAWTDESFVLEAFSEPVTLSSPVSPPPTAGSRVVEGALKVLGGRAIKLELEIEGGVCRLRDGGSLGEIAGVREVTSFAQFINRAGALRITFDRGQVLYSAEGAHRSGNLRLAINRLLTTMIGVKALDSVKSEKGIVAPSDTSFQADSCFGVIESGRTIAGGDTLVCGDAKDEVFDYLDIDDREQRLRWLHAKVQTKTKGGAKVSTGATRGSLSASGLQEVVGQAIKNLAFLRRDPSDPKFRAEAARWSGICTLPDPAQIPRLRRGSQPLAKVSGIVQSAVAVHEVAIVVPSYSKQKLTAELRKIEVGNASQPTIQLFWLLSAFAQACLEVGVRPLVFVRD